MKNLSWLAKVYILGTILIGLGLIVWIVVELLDWTNTGLYLLAAFGAVAQTLKVEGPDDRTNYSIAWFVYGFAFIAFGPAAAIFVVVISHLVEWAWHKYPWYIQSFNIAAHGIPLLLAGLVFGAVNHGSQVLDLNGVMGMAGANLVFVLINHLLVGVVVKLARGQSFAELGVFRFITLFLDFTVLTMGATAVMVWNYNPFASLLNILPLVLLYKALRVPALEHQLQKMQKTDAQIELATAGD